MKTRNYFITTFILTLIISINYASFSQIFLKQTDSISTSNVVKITLVDTNLISCSDTVFCNSANGIVITGSSANNYSYQWQMFNGTSWDTIPFAYNYQYFPGPILNTTKFLRVVKDTINGYTSNSNIITIHITPIITSNSIVNTTASICAGQSGPVLGGISPTGGNGASTYQFSWYFSVDQINWILNTGPSSLNGFPAPAIYDTTYYKRFIQSGGCNSTSNIVTVSPIIVEAIADSIINACGKVASLIAVPPLAGETGWWTASNQITFSNASDPNSNATVLTIPVPNDHITLTIHWNVQNSGCNNSVPVNVTFWQPIGPANAGEDITLIGVDSVILNATPPSYGSGFWSVVSGGGIFVYSLNAHTVAKQIPLGENIYRWIVSNGACIPPDDKVKVTVTNIKIPEGFSPNGDVVNDYFQISGIEFYPKSELFVFNRWGIEVYYKLGYDNTWDGKSLSNKVLPEDTYFYVLKLDEQNSRKGYIILKR